MTVLAGVAVVDLLITTHDGANTGSDTVREWPGENQQDRMFRVSARVLP